MRRDAPCQPAMSIGHVSNNIFDPQAVKALAAAFDDACAALHVIDRGDPRAMIVAKKIIEHARCGERDSIQLREAVLIELRAAANAR